jgi:hypothetical protein
MLCRDELPAGTSDAVRERGRDRIGLGAFEGSKGVVAEAGDDIDEVVDEVLALGIVWYVRTGRRSTTDFGARQRRRRMRDRRSRRA